LFYDDINIDPSSITTAYTLQPQTSGTDLSAFSIDANGILS
jgi:hypothetical protein